MAFWAKAKGPGDFVQPRGHRAFSPRPGLPGRWPGAVECGDGYGPIPVRVGLAHPGGIGPPGVDARLVVAGGLAWNDDRAGLEAEVRDWWRHWGLAIGWS